MCKLFELEKNTCTYIILFIHDLNYWEIVGVFMCMNYQETNIIVFKIFILKLVVWNDKLYIFTNEDNNLPESIWLNVTKRKDFSVCYIAWWMKKDHKTSPVGKRQTDGGRQKYVSLLTHTFFFSWPLHAVLFLRPNLALLLPFGQGYSTRCPVDLCPQQGAPSDCKLTLTQYLTDYHWHAGIGMYYFKHPQLPINHATASVSFHRSVSDCQPGQDSTHETTEQRLIYRKTNQPSNQPQGAEHYSSLTSTFLGYREDTLI